MKKIIYIFIFLLPIFLISCSGSSNEAELKKQLEIAEQKNKELQLEKLFYEVEMPLVKVLVNIEYNGVYVDKKILNDFHIAFFICSINSFLFSISTLIFR